ncbi:MAG TPA: long-chain fatty acid--CoA ligase [Kineosporiaceae bacterium]|nr:long-chain fatty acid--CoA ligase [Kineosporiaceae bacterium]
MSVPALTESDPKANLTDLLARNVAEVPQKVAFRRPAEGAWLEVTWAQFHADVTRLACGLVAAGVQPGDRVGLMSKTRYEWTVTDFAIWSVGAITVPIYETSSAEQVSWILSDSAAVACLVETAKHAATVADVRAGLPALQHVWVIEDGATDQLADLGLDVPDSELEQRRATLTGASIATIIYTSGTTGRPKGCELTHANFGDLAANAVARLASIVKIEGASTLLFLPLAHVFARFIQVLCVAAQAELGHTADVKNLLDDLAAFRPTFVLAVPRVFEKVYNSAEAKAEASGKGAIFHAAADTAIAWSEAQDTGGAGVLLRARHALFDRLVYARLREALGGRVTAAVSGGAPLGARLGHFFRGIGVTILEGWGLTETTAPATVNCPEQIKIGTVGQPLPGVTIRIADDGELLVKGVNVLLGYFNNEEATAAALEDGWFHTGDLGEIDDEGFVRITGRKKEIIVTAGGKNVAPAVLEDRLRAHPLVSQCIVVGDQRPFIGCLVTLDHEMLPTWLSNNGRPAMDVASAAQDPDVRAEVQKAIDNANLAVSKAESIRKFLILDTDFTEAGGHLTPKLSLRRAVILKEFAAQVEQLYA